MTLGDVTIAQWGPTGLLALTVLFILTDRLVTRQRLLDERKEKEHWRQAAGVSARQVLKLLEDRSLSVAALNSLGVEAAHEHVDEVTARGTTPMATSAD